MTKQNKDPLKKPYFGTCISNDEIKDCIMQNNLLENSTFVENIDEEVG